LDCLWTGVRPPPPPTLIPQLRRTGGLELRLLSDLYANDYGINPHLEQQCLNDQYDFTAGPTWQQQTLYFAGTQNEDAAIEFLFDTIDDLDNTGEGVYIDDISLYDCN
jgi:hypothetical protein